MSWFRFTLGTLQEVQLSNAGSIFLRNVRITGHIYTISSLTNRINIRTVLLQLRAVMSITLRRFLSQIKNNMAAVRMICDVMTMKLLNCCEMHAHKSNPKWHFKYRKRVVLFTQQITVTSAFIFRMSKPKCDFSTMKTVTQHVAT